ncbi:hypothetical protein IQ235_12925 [Oscillatoriales cyanobacterium LEGE 11467]|uniref:Uncharacterized protein n=1 Tax=Zarconia navalis LEGE 11467 TaxID=1828826 RepID=A0A928VXZ7_9CYAN|nr:hypothetical protein [Zarconia navalis]MBE9041684.1 hypothetical protein [Zarconia navalis LEGE 11467]
MNYDRIDEEGIVRRLRQTLHAPMSPAKLPSLTGNGDGAVDGELQEDLELLQASSDIYSVPLTSARKFGAIIITVKSLLRKLLRPSLEQQTIYNGANHRVVRGLKQHQQQLRKELQADLTNRFAEALELIDAQADRIARLETQIDRLKKMQQPTFENFDGSTPDRLSMGERQ